MERLASVPSADLISSKDKRAALELVLKSNAFSRADQLRSFLRFIGEMEEIAATYSAAGLPDGFHQGAAEIYRRMAIYKDVPTPSLADVVRALTPRRPA